MKCFNHYDSDSVGICRVCGKSLCRECAVAGSFGVTCRGECEKSARALGAQLEGQKRRVEMMGKFSGYYALVIGILLCLFGFTIGSSGMLREIVLVLSVGLIVYGIWLIRRRSNQQKK